MNEALANAVASVPPGRWGVGVSGGADSVALLRLLLTRGDLSPHIIHINHQTRDAESDADEAFVAERARRFGVTLTVRRWSELASSVESNNRSERFRKGRLVAYRQALDEHALQGVLLAQHRDDQVETVLHRLLRGSGYRGLCGMAEADRVASVPIRRPLLNVSRADLREYLRSLDQPWREDASNSSDAYARNRLRKFLESHPHLVEPILGLMRGCRELKATVDRLAVQFPDEIRLRDRPSQASILEEQSIRLWLGRRGVPWTRIDPDMIERVSQMMRDAASPTRSQVPGGKRLSRRAGTLRCD